MSVSVPQLGTVSRSNSLGTVNEAEESTAMAQTSYPRDRNAGNRATGGRLSAGRANIEGLAPRGTGTKRYKRYTGLAKIEGLARGEGEVQRSKAWPQEYTVPAAADGVVLTRSGWPGFASSLRELFVFDFARGYDDEDGGVARGVRSRSSICSTLKCRPHLLSSRSRTSAGMVFLTTLCESE